MPEIPYSDQHTFPSFLQLETSSSRPIIIESIEVYRYAGAYLVRATSRDGAIGTAMGNSRAAYLIPMLKGLVIPAFIGRDARQLESLVKDVYTFGNNYKFHGMPFWSCVAYVEAALFDLLGQVTGKSVGELLGGPWRDKIPVYLSSMRRDTTPQEEVDRIAERLAATGARAVKLKIGGRMLNNADSLPGRTEKLIPLARKTFGDDIELYADANGSYDSQKAIEIGRMLEANGYAFFEEPCPFEQHEATKAVTHALDIAVAGGEQDSNLAHFRRMIDECVVDIVQFDLMYNGGIIRAMQVSKLAEAAGIIVTPHSPKYSPELATFLQFASVVKNTGPYLEFPARVVEYEPWYQPAFVMQPGGFIKVPTGPGLGVAYDNAIWAQAEKL